MTISQSIKINWNWSNAFYFATLTYWFQKLWNLKPSNNLTLRIQQKWSRRKWRSFAKWLFLRAISYINPIATILNFQLDITFYSRYEIWIFHIRWKDIFKQIQIFLVSLKSDLFWILYIHLKFEIEFSNYRAISNSFYN